MNVGEILQQYLGAGAAQARSDVQDDFDRVTAQASRESLSEGLSEAFRSSQTQPFPEMLAHLFDNSDGIHRANILNELSAAIPQCPTFTPKDAERVTPEEVRDMAEQAQKNTPSTVERISYICVQDPETIKTLGAATLTVIIAKIAERQSVR